jgi:hypothetical protein
MSLRLPISLSLFAFAVSACALEPTTPDDDAAATSSLPLVIGDDCELCSSNAATISEGIAIHELDLSGVEANDQHLRIMRVVLRRPGRAPMELTPSFKPGDQLTAVDRLGNPVPDLVGAVFELRWEYGGTKRDYDLEITGTGVTDAWTWPVEKRAKVPTYTFVASPADGSKGKAPLCPSRELGAEWAGLQGQAFLFTGDRFTLNATVVDPGPGTGWFNVACVGTAPAKLHLMRHTEASSRETFTTTRDERQTMLKLLTADYCGAGERFTRDGQPLRYQDGHGWYLNDAINTKDPVTLGNIEALWGPEGATCLSRPRLRKREDIEAACGDRTPKPCSDQDVVDFGNSGAYGISVNP